MNDKRYTVLVVPWSVRGEDVLRTEVTARNRAEATSKAAIPSAEGIRAAVAALGLDENTDYDRVRRAVYAALGQEA